MAVSTLKEKNMQLPGTATGSEAEIQQCVPAAGLHKGSQKHHTELAMLKIIRGLDPINLPWQPALSGGNQTHHTTAAQCPEVSEDCWCDHADIKPQNLMLLMENNQLRVKVIDFGSAVVSAEVKRGVIMQPAAYRSPEVIMGLPITEAVDIWSLGDVLATMYTDWLPSTKTQREFNQCQTSGGPAEGIGSFS
ncbi:hypothetical protein JOQ06_020365 [Pogonophryne albipinna]|uniref:Protein kinase domain-containing protein n=1 Tax=Pogonophryne albipinna TaxID=1090488 RepID=A0AAD6FUW3_9TELE|nr:hypothetical protein JOQ06_020365 [Pogonophryne albipinna]